MIGDRADLTPLKGRTWDAAIDTSGYDPEQVSASASLDLGHYVFVSSCNAYPDWPDKPVDEDSPTWTDGEGYGQGKAADERHVLAWAAVAVVRAGLIVGPHDNIFRLPWWVRRIAEGGDGPGARGTRRDRCRSSTPATSRLGWSTSPRRARPARSTARPERADHDGRAARSGGAATGSGATLAWIPDEKLDEAEVEPWTELPLWLPARHPAPGTSDDRARRRPGLRTGRSRRRSQDIRTWLRNGGEAELDDWRAEHRPPKMSAEREAAIFRLL